MTLKPRNTPTQPTRGDVTSAAAWHGFVPLARFCAVSAAHQAEKRHKTVLGQPETRRPTRNSTRCHVLSPGMTVTLSHADAVARLGSALSDKTRTRILLALRESPAVPSDLADALGVSRQVMSNQLRCLRGCGLVTSVNEGRHTWYRLTDRHLADALDELLKVMLFVDPDCCSGEECSCA